VNYFEAIDKITAGGVSHTDAVQLVFHAEAMSPQVWFGTRVECSQNGTHTIYDVTWE
jgi:calcineurin-like phosphoesterase